MSKCEHNYVTEIEDCPYCEIADLRKRLERYEQAVEVEGYISWDNYPWPIRTLDTSLEKLKSQRVTVLVMRKEAE